MEPDWLDLSELKVVPNKKGKCIHGRDKHRCKDCGGSGSCEHKHDKRLCKDCGGSRYCIHGKSKQTCKECGGSGICIHGKNKRICKECGGSAICPHNKIKTSCSLCYKCIHGKHKYHCVDCGGKGICEHNIIKRYCKECKGTSICEHGRNKYLCKDCSGKGSCEHKHDKSQCKICNGNGVCEHGRNKYLCKECGGKGICVHGKRKTMCKECGGKATYHLCKNNCGRRKKGNKYDGHCFTCFIELFPDNEISIEFNKKKEMICEHGITKYACKYCSNNACKHGKLKQYCNECDGRMLCKSSWCEVQMNSASNKKYEGYCLYCFLNLFPDKPVIRNYKTKEKEVVDRIKEIFPEFTWIHDKRVEGGCSKRRPDLLLDLGSHIIIVEIDENKHTEYECSCENKRIMEISQDVYHRPIVFIRFNPDKYIDENGNKISSCWRLNKQGIICITKTKIDEWNYRINCLIEQIKYWIDNPSGKLVEQVQLFY